MNYKLLTHNKTMGRFYSGDISGKFWFGVQSSYDADNFGVKSKKLFNYFVCGCSCENKKEYYCKMCYTSHEEHVQSILDDECEKHDFNKRRKKLWRETECEVMYSIKPRHKKRIKKLVQTLEEQVGHYMTGYKIKDVPPETSHENSIGYEYEYEYESISMNNEEEQQEEEEQPQVNQVKLELLARLCLGKLILYCLEKRGSCTFYAEL